MTPAQLAAYEAVCEADPECWCLRITNPQSPALTVLSDMALTDHLHTRTCVLQAQGQETPWCDADAQGRWRVSRRDQRGTPEEAVAVFHSKLSAYLAAHVVRLGPPCTPIENMEKPC